MYCKNCGEQLNENQIACTKCGFQSGAGENYCQFCGSSITPGAMVCIKCGMMVQNNKKSSDIMNSTLISSVKKKSVALSIFLSLITCGIYEIFWFVSITNDTNRLSGDTQDTSGVVSFILSLITCGMYKYYWAYKMGLKRDAMMNEPKGYSHILYLILALSVPMVTYMLLQDSINKTLDKA